MRGRGRAARDPERLLLLCELGCVFTMGGDEISGIMNLVG